MSKITNDGLTRGLAQDALQLYPYDHAGVNGLNPPIVSYCIVLILCPVSGAVFSIVVVDVYAELGAAAVRLGDRDAVEVVTVGAGVERRQVEDDQQHDEDDDDDR